MPWACDVCSYASNIDARSICEMCGGKKPARAAAAPKPVANPVKPPSSSTVVLPPASSGAAGNWTCPACTFSENKAGDKLCSLCNAAKPAASIANKPLPANYKPPSVVVQEQHISELTASSQMGREYVKRAYQQNGFSKEATMNWLIQNPDPTSKRAIAERQAAEAAAKKKAEDERVAAAAAKRKADEAEAAKAAEAKRKAEAKQKADREAAEEAAARQKAAAAANKKPVATPAPAPLNVITPTSATNKPKPVAAVPTPTPKTATPGSGMSGSGNKLGTPSSTSSSAPMDLSLGSSATPKDEKELKRLADRKAVEAELAEQKAALAKKELEMRKSAAELLKQKRDEDEEKKKSADLKKQQERAAVIAAEKAEQKKKRTAQEAELKTIPIALAWVKDNYDVTRYQELVSMLIKLLTNIANQPANPKYRVINTSKPAVNRAVARPLGGLAILRMLGFKEQVRKAIDPAPTPAGVAAVAVGTAMGSSAAGSKSSASGSGGKDSKDSKSAAPPKSKRTAANSLLTADEQEAAANKPVVYYVLDGALSSNQLSQLKQTIAGFQQLLSKTGTAVSKVYANTQTMSQYPIESVYYGSIELRNVLANVVSLPDELNFRSVDTESPMYQALMKPLPFIGQLLKEFGFKHSGKPTDPFLVVSTPDPALMEAGVTELNAEIRRLAPLTPICKAMHSLLKNNRQLAAAQCVERLSAALGRIVSNPHEQKYHSISLKKFFTPIVANNANGGATTIDGGTALFTLFGFQIDVVNSMAKSPYPQPTDLERLRHRVADLNRSWAEALAAAATAAAGSGGAKK